MRSIRRLVLAPLAVLVFTFASNLGAQPLPAGERETTINAINGVVAADAQWSLVWADFVTADGIVGTADGGVLFAQEQTDKIIKLNTAGQQFTYLENTNGAGSVSLDAAGRLFAVQRTCTEPFNAEPRREYSLCHQQRRSAGL